MTFHHLIHCFYQHLGDPKVQEWYREFANTHDSYQQLVILLKFNDLFPLPEIDMDPHVQNARAILRARDRDVILESMLPILNQILIIKSTLSLQHLTYPQKEDVDKQIQIIQRGLLTIREQLEHPWDPKQKLHVEVSHLQAKVNKILNFIYGEK